MPSLMKYYMSITNMGTGPLYKTKRKKNKKKEKKVSSKVSKGDRRHAVISHYIHNDKPSFSVITNLK